VVSDRPGGTSTGDALAASRWGSGPTSAAPLAEPNGSPAGSPDGSRGLMRLRVRAMVAFGIVSLVLAGSLALVTYSLVRSSIVTDREDAAVRQA
jgi:hypothetical protein